jgi:3',5'-cyclic AMP phosphodiesterase CpdA
MAAGEPDQPGMNARCGAEASIAGIAFVLDCDGALYWPEEGLLAIADLHLEKGSSFATRGVLLPPYDTAATLARLAGVVARYAPRAVIAPGDSFHDDNGAARIAPGDRAALVALQRGRDWIWIAGNHDAEAAKGMGGSFAAALAVGCSCFATSRAAPTARSRVTCTRLRGWAAAVTASDGAASRATASV